MPADPNWLYATVAQSSAAIVAIIGGLVTASLLQMEAGRNTLLERINDRQQELATLERERDDAAREAHRVRTSFLFRDRIDDILRFDPAGYAEQAQHRLRADYIPTEIFEELWERLAREIDRERQLLEIDVAQHPPAGLDFEKWHLQHAINLAERNEWLARRIYNQLVGRGVGSQFPEYLQEERSEIEQCEARVRDVERRIIGVRAELDYLRQNLRTVPERTRGTTRSVGLGMAILALFAMTGIVGPLLFMPMDADSFTLAHKAGIIAVFSLDLLLLFGYVTFVLRNIRRA